MRTIPPVIFPTVVTRKVNVSFVGQAYPGIQLSANEKKSGGSICSAPGAPGRSGAKSEQEVRGIRPRARGRAYLGQNFLRLASCVVLSEDRLSQPASVRIGVACLLLLLLLSPAAPLVSSSFPPVPFHRRYATLVRHDGARK